MSARILLIEDHPANRQLMEYLLGAFGHELTSAATGLAGVEAAIRDLPNLIVCDIQLPDIDGFEVIERLKSHPATRSIPVLAVTAYAMAGDHKRMLEAGFDGYISKPIEPEHFVSEVEEFLPDRARSGRAAARTSAPGTSATPREATRGVRVLAVDDSKANLGVLRAILEPRGFDVIPARSPSQALRLASQDPPDLVLSDIHMADGDGFDLIRRLKDDEVLREIPVIFLSTTVWRDADREHGMALGAADFILRPVEPDTLVSRIQGALERVGHGHDRRR